MVKEVLTDSEVQAHKDFSERFAHVLEVKHLTLLDVSRLTGVTYTSLSAYKSGKKVPGYLNLLSICTGLRVSADYLMGLRKVKKDGTDKG